MRTDRKMLGKASEDAAAKYLRKQGLRPISRNYTCTFGEVDLIVREGDCLVFVEVRSSKDAAFAHPKYSVGPKKRRTLSKVALSYLKKHGLLNRPARFDVVTVVHEGDNRSIEWTKNAFDLEY